MLRAPNTTGILKGVNALKRTKKEQHDSRFIFLMLFPALLVPICMTYYPMFKGIVMAFQNYKLTNINNIYWNNFANFKQLFTRSITNEFYGTMKNTLIWVVVSLAFQFLVGFGLALVLKKKFRGSSLYQGLVFFPWAVSGFVIALIWRWMFNGTSGVFNDMLMRMGLIGEPVGWLAGKNTAMLCCVITNIWYGVPFFTIMISAALRGIDPGLYEAAEVDGANPLQRFWAITVPSISPVLKLTLLLRVIWIFNFAEIIYTMTKGGPSGSTEIITTLMMKFIDSFDYGMASATGVVCIIILTIFASSYVGMLKMEDAE